MSVADLKIKSDIDKRTPPRRFREGGKKHYRVNIWLAGAPADLQSVRSVRYELHESFKKPDRYSDSPVNQFRITIRTYGFFGIKAVITDVNGDTYPIQDRVTFDPSQAPAEVDDPFEPLRKARMKIRDMKF